MRMKADLGNLQNSHDRIIHDIKGMHNLKSENGDLVQTIQTPKLNEMDDSHISPTRPETTNKTYNMKMLHDLQDSMHILKEDMKRIDFQHQQQAFKESQHGNNTKYNLSEDNIKSIVEKKLQEAYKMSPWQELNMYKNKMNEQHQHVMSVLGNLEGKYNTVENKVNCVKCNQNMIENYNNRSNLETPSNETLDTEKSITQGRLNSDEHDNRTAEKVDDKKINMVCNELSSRMAYVELELKRTPSKTELDDTKNLVATQLSNIYGLVQDYQKKFDKDGDSKMKLVHLENAVKNIESQINRSVQNNAIHQKGGSNDMNIVENSEDSNNLYRQQHTSVLRQMLRYIQDIHRQLNIIKNRNRKQQSDLNTFTPNYNRSSNFEVVLNDISNATDKILKDHDYIVNKMTDISNDHSNKNDVSNLSEEIETLKSSLKSETINVLGVIKDLKAQRGSDGKNNPRLLDIETKLDRLILSQNDEPKRNYPSSDFNHRLMVVEKECAISKDNFGYVSKISEDLKKESGLIREKVKQIIGDNIQANTTLIKIEKMQHEHQWMNNEIKMLKQIIKNEGSNILSLIDDINQKLGIESVRTEAIESDKERKNQAVTIFSF